MKQGIFGLTYLLAMILAVTMVIGGLPAEAADGDLSGRTIVVDPGHGGNSGARGPAGTWEDDNVYAIAVYLKNMLEKAGAKVVMTRGPSSTARVPEKPWLGQLAARMDIANRSGADLFISIHNNANPDRSYTGIGTYYNAAKGTADLARKIQEALIAATGERDHGIIPAAFYVLRNAQMPAVLAEIGFISNPGQEEQLRTEEFRLKAARGLYQGIMDFFGVVPAAESGQITETENARVAEAAKGNGYSPLVLGYWAKWGNDQDPLRSLKANLESIDLFAPYWYTLMGDGNLKAREEGHQELIDLVHAGGGKVLVMINNSKDSSRMISDPAVRERAIKNIENLVDEYGYDGVNIDFEALQPGLRDDLTAFMKGLSERLGPKGRMVTMAVVAKWSKDESTNDFAVAYDYEALAEYVDKMVIMTYDQHGMWSGPGPVASIGWVRSVLDYATELVPREKILLGIAGYGYEWSPSGVRSIKARDAMALAESMGAEVVWDDRHQVPRFSAGNTSVWFENSWSIAQKLMLAEEYGVGGIALWSLGQEEDRTWDVIREWVGERGLVFPDVAGHWARWEIEVLAEKDRLKGYPDGTFRPDRAVTRAEMLKVLVESLGLSSRKSDLPFKDIDRNHWGYDYLTQAYGLGLVRGYEDSTLRADQALTRAELATLLSRALDVTGKDLKAKQNVLFPDITGHWSREQVIKLAGAGIIAGYPDGSFYPDRGATRAEAFVMLLRTGF